jgi:hypothetical protein
MKIRRPILGSLTQGVIFSCALAEKYRSKEVHGLIVTARCDLEQEKYPTLNYLPIVTLDDWLEVDGYDIIFSRATKDCEGSCDRCLKEAEIAPSILMSLTLAQVWANFFENPGITKKAQAVKVRFQEIVTRLELLRKESRTPEDMKLFWNYWDGMRKSIIKDLALHKLLGYYFLPSILEDGPRIGYVILLREMRAIPSSVARLIANGVEKDHSALSALVDSNSYLSFETDNFSMPIGELPSPEIEHILQCFSFLFGRIGVEDIDKEYLLEICNRQPKAAGVVI